MTLNNFLCMICLYTIALAFVWPVLRHKTWHIASFLTWFRCHGSWSWAWLLQLITAPLWFNRSDTSHCFVFISWCQWLCLWAAHCFTFKIIFKNMSHIFWLLKICYYDSYAFPVGIYLLKFNNRNTRTSCKICLKLTIKTPERRRQSILDLILAVA